MYFGIWRKVTKMIEILDFCFVKSPKKQHFYDIKHFFTPKYKKVGKNVLCFILFQYFCSQLVNMRGLL